MTKEAENAGLALQKFSEGVRHAEQKMFDFISGKTEKPAEIFFRSGSISRQIGYEFENLKAELKDWQDGAKAEADEADRCRNRIIRLENLLNYWLLTAKSDDMSLEKETREELRRG